MKQMKPKTIALLVVGVLFIFLLWQNRDPLSIDLFFWSTDLFPLFVLIIFTLLLGLVTGWFTHVAFQKGKQKKAVASVVSKEVKAEVKRQVKDESGQAEKSAD